MYTKVKSPSQCAAHISTTLLMTAAIELHQDLHHTALPVCPCLLFVHYHDEIHVHLATKSKCCLKTDDRKTSTPLITISVLTTEFNELCTRRNMV